MNQHIHWIMILIWKYLPSKRLKNLVFSDQRRLLKMTWTEVLFPFSKVQKGRAWHHKNAKMWSQSAKKMLEIWATGTPPHLGQCPNNHSRWYYHSWTPGVLLWWVLSHNYCSCVLRSAFPCFVLCGQPPVCLAVYYNRFVCSLSGSPTAIVPTEKPSTELTFC